MLEWVPATKKRVRDILTQEAYSGLYVYGASRTIRVMDPESDAPRERREATPLNEQARKPDHHPAYVQPETFAENLYRLSQNRNRRIGPLGRGEALGQGLLRCEVHKRTLRTAYPTRGRTENGKPVRLGQYRCVPSPSDLDLKPCVQIAAKFIDPLIEEEVLGALKVPSLELVQEAAREALREYESLERGRADELRRAAAAAAESEREFSQTDAVNYPSVKRTLKKRWEEALQAVQVVEEFHRKNPLEPPLTLDGSELERLRQRFDHLPSLWRHPKITAEQRKAVVRTVIKHIVIRPARDVLTLEISWVGGAATTHEVETWRRIGDEIERAYRMGGHPSDIAEELTQRGAFRRLGARGGEPYDGAAVEAVVARRRIQQQLDREAYSYIRTRVLEHASSHTIAAELNEKSIRHRRGQWTPKRVQAAIHRLRHKLIRGVDPLPLVQSLRPRIEELNDRGLLPKEIVAQINAEGLRNRHRTPITLAAVYGNFRYFGIRPAVVAQNERLNEFLRTNFPVMTMPQLVEHVRQLGFRTRWGTPLSIGALYRRAAALGLRISKPRNHRRGLGTGSSRSTHT